MNARATTGKYHPGVKTRMALVVSDRDYKRITVFSKIAGVFTFTAGTVSMVDHGEPIVGIGLVLLGAFFVLAPLPMTVVKPEGVAAEEDGYLTLNE